ncbi:Outer membrane receptor proteins, mostly Fe transport [Novosphingobium sp. CF614]|uniref:TonB-dependent receptor n=1 Tax=Novosphingobium sp. CF614 TaxID=1884364 RepID=UPI0008EACE71|nr:TonB-dependent receptor [Novosphingobium sp. CF614]SFG00556.1 Outer membrane receptor proteins, mostly Fe transport [Novosphingobium sp. CF614]
MSLITNFNEPGLYGRRLRRALAASCAVAALAGGFATAHAADAEDRAPATGDSADANVITVTALRREQSINEVPVSITSYDKHLMDQQGIRGIDDLSRLTPALNFAPSAGVTANNGSNISIRGLASDVGSATTAIYIDDTAIQIRNVGYYGGNPYPKVFDLDRVEVLYGPQGTLFGASAEGGAVRFITPGPDYDALHLYSRSQVSFTEEGSPSYEAGLALGAPITDNLAFRMSGWYQHTGGYIDQVTQGTDVVKAKDVNSGNSAVLRAVLGWKATDTLTVTPSFYYQRVHGKARDDYWEGYGLAKDNDYHTGVYSLEPSTDTFYLPALKVEWKVASNIDLITNTSYFDRKQEQTLNYATYFSVLRSGSPFGTFSNKDITNMDDYLTVKQKNFVQEARLQSYGNKLIDWTVGAYYANTEQDFSNYTSSGRIPGTLINGYQQYDGRYSYVNLVNAKDKQIAGYASIDAKPTEALTLTAAIRYSHVDFDFTNVADGTTTRNVRTVTTASMKEAAWTPKFGISYKISPNNMVYASATKGFRPGGAQAKILSDLCTGDLNTLGLTESPTAYGSDSLWSYEAGTKNSLFGGAVQLGASAYLMKWKNIQQSVRLPTCSFSFIYNLGDATGKGGELSIDVRPVEGLNLGGNLAYVHLTYDDNVYGGNGLMLKADGQHIGGPSWTGHLFGSYEREVGDGVDAYLRGDFSFASHTYQTAVSGAYGYDSGLTELPGRNFVSARMGARFSGVDLSVFVDNLLNSNDVLARNHDSIGSTLYYDQTYRPRTVGLTLQYRY